MYLDPVDSAFDFLCLMERVADEEPKIREAAKAGALYLTRDVLG